LLAESVIPFGDQDLYTLRQTCSGTRVLN
jgi:hypothetical protein